MNKVFDTIGRFIIKYAKMNIALILCLTIFFVFGITKIEMKMGNDVFLSNTSDVYKDTETYQKRTKNILAGMVYTYCLVERVIHCFHKKQIKQL